MKPENKLLEAKNNLVEQYLDYSKDIKSLDPEELKRMKFIGSELKYFEIKVGMISKALEEFWRYVHEKVPELKGAAQDEYKLACKIISKEVPNYVNSYGNTGSK